ncbi:MAG TPA: hypothetical protein VMZ27_17285 [Candidatus Saccharimonadales bacterium]|nr:hypothetical protein [Candidatus Saccharimonadales bacterium]
MIHPDLLENLRCPETKQRLHLAQPEILDALNGMIARGELKNRGGNGLTEKIDGGLVREDGKFLYPVRRNLPIMLIDEAIALKDQ